MSRHRLNENDQTTMLPATLLPATVEELAASERDEADGTGSRRRTVTLAAVATSVLMLSTAGWAVLGPSADDASPDAGPTRSRPGLPYVDGFGLNTASAGAVAPPISRGTPNPRPSASASNPASPAASPSVGPNPIAPPPESPVPALLSRGAPATASSYEHNHSEFHPSRAVDGNINTRWASAYADQQWIRVDLGKSRRVTRVQLRWEVAFGRRYEVQVSADGSTWSTVSSIGNGDGGIDEHNVEGTGRYVRIMCQQRGTEYGFSLWELEIYGY